MAGKEKQAGSSGRDGTEAFESGPQRSESENGGDDAAEGPGNVNLAGQASDRGAEREDHADDLASEETRGDFPGGVMKNQVLAGGGWELVHGGRSLTVSVTAGILLVVLDISEPSSPGAAWVLAAFGGYFCALLGMATAERRLFREKQAEPPADGRAGGRMALLMAGLVFWVSGEEAGARLAPWLAMAALLLGGVSDGAWVALVSARRGAGLWRVWRALLGQGREARRLCWSLLFGGGREHGDPWRKP